MMKNLLLLLLAISMLFGCTDSSLTPTDKFIEKITSEAYQPKNITYVIVDKSVSFVNGVSTDNNEILDDLLWNRLRKSGDMIVLSIAMENTLNPNNQVIKEILTPLPKLQGLSELQQKQYLSQYFKMLIDEKKKILQEIEHDLLNIESTQKQTEIVECLTHVHTILERYPDSDIKLVAITDARQVSERFYLNAKNHNEATELAKSHVEILINDLGVKPIFDQMDEVKFILPQDSILTKIETGNFSKTYWQGIFSELGYQKEVILTTKDI